MLDNSDLDFFIKASSNCKNSELFKSLNKDNTAAVKPAWPKLRVISFNPTTKRLLIIRSTDILTSPTVTAALSMKEIVASSHPTMFRAAIVHKLIAISRDQKWLSITLEVKRIIPHAVDKLAAVLMIWPGSFAPWANITAHHKNTETKKSKKISRYEA